MNGTNPWKCIENAFGGKTGNKVSNKLYDYFDGDVNQLLKASEDTLSFVTGLGPSTAKKVHSILSFNKAAISHIKEIELLKPSLMDPDHIFREYKHLFENRETEGFLVIYLNRRNAEIYKYMIEGALHGVIIDINILAKRAIIRLASAIVIIHNHPSGNLKPSDSDIKLTNEIKNICSLIKVKLLDHIIIGSEKYYSFSSEGLI